MNPKITDENNTAFNDIQNKFYNHYKFYQYRSKIITQGQLGPKVEPQNIIINTRNIYEKSLKNLLDSIINKPHQDYSKTYVKSVCLDSSHLIYRLLNPKEVGYKRFSAIYFNLDLLIKLYNIDPLNQAIQLNNYNLANDSNIVPWKCAIFSTNYYKLSQLDTEGIKILDSFYPSANEKLFHASKKIKHI